MSGIRSINSNLPSLRAQQLAQNTQGLQCTFEHLSSGLRIVRAADDAAGLAIASSLNADQRVYGRGVRNLNDGVSYPRIPRRRAAHRCATRVSAIESRPAGETRVSSER